MIRRTPTGTRWALQTPNLELKFFKARSLQYRGRSENKSCQQVDRVVARRIPPSAVVVHLSAVEPQIARVLHGKIKILCGPPRSIQNVAITLGASVGASRNWSLGKEQRISGSGDVKESGRPRKLRAKVIFDVCLRSVQMVGSLRRGAGSERGQQRRVLADISAADGKHVVPEFGNRSVILKIRAPICIAVRDARDGVGSALHMHAIAADF